MNFFIERSAIVLFGRSVELYGLIALLGAVTVTVVNTLIAKRRSLDTSLVFRVTAVMIFVAAAFHVFFQNTVPSFLLGASYALGAVALPLVFRLCGYLFRADKNAFTSLGILTVLEYSVFTRLSCTFAGCCYGPPWSGAVSLVYGTDTHNPLPGVSLFPLQPLAVLVLLCISVAAITVFLKKKSQKFIWSLLMLNLAVYYAIVFISPTGDGRDVETLIFTVIFLAASAVLLFIKPKGIKNV